MKENYCSVYVMNVLHKMLISYDLTIHVKIVQGNLSPKKIIKLFFLFPFEHVRVDVEYSQYHQKSGENIFKII